WRMSDSTSISPTADPILAEVWRIKEEIAAEHDYDVRKIAEAAMEAQKQHGDRVVDLSKGKAEQEGARQPATGCGSTSE
ncbi:MAG TPA: hypothetical protein VMN36_19365, partial [Verrucomicrobiales bacterium]|nr:hypothetical protein [Verrucomicrobiales bacterium]